MRDCRQCQHLVEELVFYNTRCGGAMDIEVPRYCQMQIDPDLIKPCDRFKEKPYEESR